MENKQTAVEWLVANLHFLIVQHKGMQFEMMVEKAKAMEKEQIIYAHGIKMKGVNNHRCVSGEQYYNETYGK